MIHDFEKSLAVSHEHADAPWWEAVYRAAFGPLLSCASVRQDGWAQRAGIDRIVTTEYGRTIKIDEKIRTEDWPDFLLERWSDESNLVAGWVQKKLDCEYIAYAFVPSASCYLLPTLTLQRAWRLHGRAWIDAYPEIRARNKTHGRCWTTLSVAVPHAVLLEALSDAMLVRWNARPPQLQQLRPDLKLVDRDADIGPLFARRPR